MLASPMSGAICSIPVGRAYHLPGSPTGPASWSSARLESLYSCVPVLTPFRRCPTMQSIGNAEFSSPPAPEKVPVNPVAAAFKAIAAGLDALHPAGAGKF